MILTNLDLDALRTLTLAEELGSLTRVATHLNRTPSAISLQMKRLQTSADATLFRRSGRTIVLTPQGEIALSYARRMLELNDELLDALRGASQTGSLRIGFAEDFAQIILPQALARFTNLYPLVKLEVIIGRSTFLQDEIDGGRMDLGLLLLQPSRKTEGKLADLPLHWVSNLNYEPSNEEPLSLALFEPPCIFRSRALDALEACGRSSRIAVTSSSIAGLWAAVSAGLGLTARAGIDLPARLQIVDQELPSLGEVSVVLRKKKHLRAPHLMRLAEYTEELVREKLATRRSDRPRGN